MYIGAQAKNLGVLFSASFPLVPTVLCPTFPPHSVHHPIIVLLASLQGSRYDLLIAADPWLLLFFFFF